MQILVFFDQSMGNYESPHIFCDLRVAGVACGETRFFVRRFMLSLISQYTLYTRLWFQGSPSLRRKLPHQVDNSKLEIPVLNVLGMNSMGVLSPRESWGLNSL